MINYFTGNKMINSIILCKMDNNTLSELLKTCKYFNEYNYYDKLWSMKIINEFGLKYIKKDYDNLKNYYITLLKSIMYEIGLDFYESNKNNRFNFIAMKFIEMNQIDIRIGDLVHLECVGDYRNHGKMIYNGCNFTFLDRTTADPEGIIPKEFYIWTGIHKFPKNYWYNTIDHNYNVWLNFDHIKELPHQIHTHKDIIYITVNINNNTHYIVTNEHQKAKLLKLMADGGLELFDSQISPSLDNIFKETFGILYKKQYFIYY